MISAKQIYQYTLLSEASYAAMELNAGVISGSQLAGYLQEANGLDWSAELASEFATNWRVVSHQPNTDSGFSATVFEGKGEDGNPRYVFAARGTEPTVGGSLDLTDLLADVADVVANGLAWDQIIDMCNYFKSLITPVGESYQFAKTEIVSTVELGVMLLENRHRDDFICERIGADRFLKISFEEQSGLGVLPPDARFDATGHSLGGHLATAFSRLFPQNAQDVLTVNGAGYTLPADLYAFGNVDRLFAALGGAKDCSACTSTDKHLSRTTRPALEISGSALYRDAYVAQ